MEKKTIKFHSTSYAATQNIYVEIPFLCPVCSVSNNPSNSLGFVQSYGSADKNLVGLMHRCTACNNLFFTLQLVEAKKGTLLLQYPEANNRVFDELISKMSPRFIELYNQSLTAEKRNHIDLAGMGYRASLEVLIKDYALYFSLDSKEEVAKLNLNNAIGRYFKNDDSIISADVVRKLGNDYAHWEKDHADLPLSILKAYLEIFIKQIEVKLMLKHPPVQTRTP